MNRTAAERLIQECWDEVPLRDENDVTAIRSMTPASNGIARGEVSKFDWNIQALKYFIHPSYHCWRWELSTMQLHISTNSDTSSTVATQQVVCGLLGSCKAVPTQVWKGFGIWRANTILLGGLPMEVQRWVPTVTVP